MESIMKTYKKIKANDDNVTHIKCELYYDLGGYNVFSYKEEPRGYYVSTSPVTRGEVDGYVMESYVAFSGYKKCIHEVKRRSKKAEEKAKEIAFSDGMLAEVLLATLNRYGYELA